MKSLRLENGHLFTEVKIDYENKSVIFKRMLVHTSSTETILSTKKMNKLSMDHGGDEIEHDRIEVSISVGPLKIKGFPLKLEKLDDDVDGILGLDFLKRVGAKINLESMTLSGSRVN